jgi:hypothetical protein
LFQDGRRKPRRRRVAAARAIGVGCDWPQVFITSPMPNDDGDLLDVLARWVPDAAARQRILVASRAKPCDFPLPV